MVSQRLQTWLLWFQAVSHCLARMMPGAFSEHGGSKASARSKQTAWRCRNVSCGSCGCKDSQADPVNKDAPVMWGYVMNGLTSGLLCWYCNKVYANLYRIKYKDVKAWTKAMGEQKELHEEMLHYRQQAVDQRVQAGRHSHVKVSFSQKLDMKKSRELELEDPEDYVFEMEHYKSMYGDPLSNGLGHKVCCLPGETRASVIVPSAPVRKIKRRVKLAAEMSSSVAEGEQMEFGEDASSKLQNDLFASFDLTHGIGASLDNLLSGQSACAAPKPLAEGRGVSSAMSVRVAGEACAKLTPPKGESPTQPAGSGDNGLAAFAIGPCNLAPLLSGAGAAAAAPDLRAEPPSKFDTKTPNKTRAKAKALPARQGDPSPRPSAGPLGKKGRPGMDLVLVTKSHVEARTTQLIRICAHEFEQFQLCCALLLPTKHAKTSRNLLLCWIIKIGTLTEISLIDEVRVKDSSRVGRVVLFARSQGIPLCYFGFRDVLWE